MKLIGNKIIEEAEKVLGCSDKNCDISQNSKQCIILNKIVNELIKPMQNDLNNLIEVINELWNEDESNVQIICNELENNSAYTHFEEKNEDDEKIEYLKLETIKNNYYEDERENK